MSDPTTVLGVDGGGTSTVAWLADRRGQILGRGRAGASNQKAVGPDAARAALGEAIAGAFMDADRPSAPAAVACFGLAGFDRPEDKRLLEGWADALGWGRRLVLANDAELVLAAGTPDGWGVALIAGTGSIAVGRTPEGRTARAGGWGHLIGDEGSAYAVALDAMRRLARHVDGRSPILDGYESLAAEVSRALEIEAPDRLVSAVYAPGVDRTRLAAVAPAVVRAADSGSAEARAILTAAAAELAATVRSVAAALGLDRPAAPLPLAIAGSFLLGADRLAGPLVESLADLHVRVTRVPEPVAGAIALALRAIDP